MVSAQDVISIYKYLLIHDIPVWLTGGWGIDALLGKQTRPHKDLDVVMLLGDIHQMCELLKTWGYELKEYWSENRCVEDSKGNIIATAFVLVVKDDREFDVHAMRIDDLGNGIPAWVDPRPSSSRKKTLPELGRSMGFRSSVSLLNHR